MKSPFRYFFVKQHCKILVVVAYHIHWITTMEATEFDLICTRLLFVYLMFIRYSSTHGIQNFELLFYVVLYGKKEFCFVLLYLSISDTFLPSSGEKRLFHSFYNTQRRLLFATWLNIDYYYSWSHHIKTASQKVFCKCLHNVVTRRNDRKFRIIWDECCFCQSK